MRTPDERSAPARARRGGARRPPRARGRVRAEGEHSAEQQRRAGERRRGGAPRADRAGDHDGADDVGRLERRRLERERGVHAGRLVAEQARPERAQARPERREGAAGQRSERDGGRHRDARREQRERRRSRAVDASAAGTSTGACPRRSTSRPSSGPVTPLASAYAPATAPPAANDPVSPRVCRISTSPSAEAGSRPAIEARNSGANPGTRSRLRERYAGRGGRGGIAASLRSPAPPRRAIRPRPNAYDAGP